MHDLLITSSGYSGGNRGPQGLYDHLQGALSPHQVTVLQLNTIPDDVMKNVEQIIEVVKKNMDNYRHIYLMGWSMGGANVLLAAHQLTHEHSMDQVKGIVLIGTQTEGTQALSQLSIPVLFFHGGNDAYFSADSIKSIFERYQAKKKMIVFNNLGHEFTSHASLFATRVGQAIADFFLSSEKNSPDFSSENFEEPPVSSSKMAKLFSFFTKSKT